MSEDNVTSSNAVIFQAPAPAPEKPARVSRRASAPAGPPVVAPAASSAPAEHAESKNAESQNAESQNAETKPKATRSRSRKPAASADAPAEREPKQSRSDTSDGDDNQSSSPDSGQGDGEGEDAASARRRRRRGGRGRGRRTAQDDGQDGNEDDSRDDAEGDGGDDALSDDGEGDGDGGPASRRRRRSRSTRTPRTNASSSSSASGASNDDNLQGSTRLQAKRQRRRETRDGSRRRPVISEAEFLARRESVKRDMIVRDKDGRVQIAVLEDDVLVEHYVSHQAQQSMAGNVYLARVQNVLSGMEAAFVDVGRGRNAVLYAGEVNWDAAGLDGRPKRIELALKPGDTVMVQVTKDPIGHKGARVTSQISLAGRFLVYVPGGGVTGISRKLPENERNRLKKLLREVIPADAGVIVRTAAEGASEDELRADVERLKRQWESIEAEAAGVKAPALLRGEPDMAIRVVRDIFNEDFESLTIQGDDTWNSLSAYVGQVAPDLASRLYKFHGDGDVFYDHRIDEQLSKGMDRKVWLPSGGSLVIDRTEAMTVIDVNTGKFVGKGGTLEETMTLNNLEAAEEIVRQLRLRDIGGIIVIDFVDMLLEANRDRVLRRLIEGLSRDRTKHQVAEVTSLGLVQMTRKRVGQGLVEAFSTTCEHCKGRGFLVQGEPVGESSEPQPEPAQRRRASRAKAKADEPKAPAAETHALDDREEARAAVKATLASIAAAAEKAHQHGEDEHVDVIESLHIEAEDAPLASD